MAWYRKIDVRILNDKKFRALTDDGKLVFFILLVHPMMTAIGAMRGTLPGLASEMGWIAERFSKAFDEALAKGMAKHDPIASVIWLPNFIRYNAPENPNVLRSWAIARDLLPECDLTTQAIHSVKAFADTLHPSFPKAFAEAFSKPSPKQEQEQEQEQEKPPAPTSGAVVPLFPEKPKVKIVDGNVTMKTFFARCREAGQDPIPESDAVFAYAAKAGIPHAFVLLAWKSFRADYEDSPKKRIDWRKTFLNCVKATGYGLWTVDAVTSQYVLTGKGRQAEKVHAKAHAQ